VKAPAPAVDDPREKQTARLLEQLMQVARTAALEEMVSGIAHELNQPIGAIATFAQAGERMLGKAEPMVSAAKDVLRHISNEAMTAGAGIHRIRKLFNGGESVSAPCDMSDVVAELLPVLELLAARADTRLEVSLQEHLPHLSVDRLRIQHVLFTLVDNAMDAARLANVPGPVRIEVAGDRYAVVTSVTDHGIGIDEEARERLFRPFFTTKPNGSGLGLASSRAIVEAHEGTIGFENNAGGGARFWFRLPAHSEAPTK
jgi:two-component system sensor kinase FixL